MTVPCNLMYSVTIYLQKYSNCCTITKEAAEKAEVYKGDPVDTFDPIQVVRVEEVREKEGHVSVRMLYTAVQASCQHGHERGRGERQGIHGPLMVGGDWAAVYLPKAGKMN